MPTDASAPAASSTVAYPGIGTWGWAYGMNALEAAMLSGTVGLFAVLGAMHGGVKARKRLVATFVGAAVLSPLATKVGDAVAMAAKSEDDDCGMGMLPLAMASVCASAYAAGRLSARVS